MKIIKIDSIIQNTLNLYKLYMKNYEYTNKYFSAA